MTNATAATTSRPALAAGDPLPLVTTERHGHVDATRSLVALPPLSSATLFSILFIMLFAAGCSRKSARSVCYYGVMEELQATERGKEVLEKLPPRKAMDWKMEYEPWDDVHARGKDWQEVQGYFDLVDGSSRIQFTCRVRYPKPGRYWRTDPEPQLLEVSQLSWTLLRGDA